MKVEVKSKKLTNRIQKLEIGITMKQELEVGSQGGTLTVESRSRQLLDGSWKWLVIKLEVLMFEAEKVMLEVRPQWRQYITE